MDTARAGSPRRTPTAAMVVAFSACSVLRRTSTSPTSARQPSGAGNGPTPRSTRKPTTARTASKVRPTRSTRAAPPASVRRPRDARPLVEPGSLVRMQCRVQLDALPLPRDRFDGAGDRVAAEEDVVDAGELGGLDHLRLVVHVPHGDL